MLIAGDFNADPAVTPCLAKGISAGRFVDLALPYSLGTGKKPDATCKFRREDCAGSRRDFILGCSDALAASTIVRARIGGSLRIFLFLLAFVSVVGLLMLLALGSASLSGRLAGLTLPIGPPLR